MTSAAVIFSAALVLSLEVRAAHAAASSVADEVLRARVLELLAAHDEAQALLATPLAHRPIGAECAAGALIGRYKLLEKLGEGGCGVV